MSLDEMVIFDTCKTRHCVNVTIINDFESEPDEIFFYTLERTPDLHPNIILDPVFGEVVIVDDGDG